VAEVLRIIESVSGTAFVTVAGMVAQKEKTTTEMANCRDCRLVRRDGFEFGVDIKVAPIYDHDGSVAGSVVTFHDVSAARAKTLEMSHSAQHDVLTDLPNRALFNDRLMQAIELAKRQDNQLAVMFVDIDHFKKINDSLGHDVGDKLLQSVAKRLVASVRRSDTISRMAGDEFVVLLSQVEHAEDVAFSARKILRALSVPYLINNKSLDINVSIGVSTYPADGQDAEGLISTADNAMYEAKQHGRNNFQFFRHEMHAQLAERQSLEADLRYALGRNEFVLH
jgi:diguanylate cyclase (GGDEF)-like protein